MCDYNNDFSDFRVMTKTEGFINALEQGLRKETIITK